MDKQPQKSSPWSAKLIQKPQQWPAVTVLQAGKLVDCLDGFHGWIHAELLMHIILSSSPHKGCLHSCSRLTSLLLSELSKLITAIGPETDSDAQVNVSGAAAVYLSNSEHFAPLIVHCLMP